MVRERFGPIVAREIAFTTMLETGALADALTKLQLHHREIKISEGVLHVDADRVTPDFRR